ncbi:unnamed protein product, partial [Oppiella nova]
MTYYNNTTQLTVYYCWDSDDDLAFSVAVYQLFVITSRSGSRKEHLICWPTLRHHKQNIDNTTSSNSHSNTSDITRGRKQVIKMLLLIVILFMLCWGPRLVMNVLIKLGLQSFSHSAYTARIACYLLSFIHSALNPFVYGLMSSNFRRM